MNTSFHSPNSTRQLKYSLFIYLASALFVVTVLFSFVVYFILFDQLKEAEDHKLYHAAEMESIAVSQWARRAKDLALQVTSRTRIRQELEKYNRGEISLESLNDFTKPKLDDAMSVGREITGIARLDDDNIIVSLSGDAAGFFSYDSSAGSYTADSVKLSAPVNINGRDIVIASAPILNSEKRKEGTDLVFIDTYQLKKIVSPSTAENRIDIYLAMFSESSQAVLGKIKSTDEYNSVRDRYIEILEKAVSGETGITEAGNEVVVYFPVKESETWGIAAASNRTALYAPLYEKLSVAGILFAAVFIITLSGFSVLMKPLAGKILMRSTELEERIREKTENLEKEISERKKSEMEKETVIKDLEEAVSRIRKLQGLLPICSVCKKIRDDKGYWQQLETYISENSEAGFSHGLCPECYEKALADVKNLN